MNSKVQSFIDQKIEELYHVGPIDVSDATNRVRYILRKISNYEGELVNTHYKYLFHEIIPIVSVALHLKSSANSVEFMGYNAQAQIDGIIHFLNKKQNIEVTTAINPEDKGREIEFCLRYGYKPIPNQKIDEVQCGPERGSLPIGSAREFDRDVLFPIMEKALGKKVRAAGKNEKYQGAWLVLVIDDFVCPPSLDADTRVWRFDPLCQHLLKNAAEMAPFSRIFIVGVSGTYLFDSKTGQGYILSHFGIDTIAESRTE